MTITSESALRILIPRRNSPAHLRHETRRQIRLVIALMQAEGRGRPAGRHRSRS